MTSQKCAGPVVTFNDDRAQIDLLLGSEIDPTDTHAEDDRQLVRREAFADLEALLDKLKASCLEAPEKHEDPACVHLAEQMIAAIEACTSALMAAMDKPCGPVPHATAAIIRAKDLAREILQLVEARP